ncbi:hypothetical protein NC651_030792 [Populus alba x Populus x berolinensis]|nr:hypothetical protein NC651_030792 [Populus alba x Populus x berolinensis]
MPKPFKGSSWIVICAFSCKFYKPATRKCRKETKNICSRHNARAFLEDLG